MCVCVCVCVSMFPGNKDKMPNLILPHHPCHVSWVLDEFCLLKKAKHFNVATECVTTGSVLFPIPQLFLQVCNLFARCLHTESVSFYAWILFPMAGLCVKQTLEGRPHTEASCCQLNWNSPGPGDRAGRQWKPAVIKADRVSGKRRNRSAMSVTKVLAWQWEKYKLSMAQTIATQYILLHTNTQTNEAK